jgi:hypothetical protein
VTGLIDIARIICSGDEPPSDWLVSALETARDALAGAVSAEAQYPSRNTLLDRLRTLEAAAKFVRANLRDSVMAPMLLNGDWQFLNQNEMHHGLGDVARRAKRMIDAIPKRQGRDKFFVGEGLTPQVKCALMASIIWERAHGRWPPVDNYNAKNTCDMLWTAAGGSKSGGGWGGTGDQVSVSGWRNHLRAAKAAGQSMEAKHIRGFLALALR